MKTYKTVMAAGTAVLLVCSFTCGRMSHSPSHELHDALNRVASADVVVSMRAQSEIIASYERITSGLSRRIKEENNPHTLAVYLNLLYEISKEDALKEAQDRLRTFPDRSGLESRLPEDMLNTLRSPHTTAATSDVIITPSAPR